MSKLVRRRKDSMNKSQKELRFLKAETGYLNYQMQTL